MKSVLLCHAGVRGAKLFRLQFVKTVLLCPLWDVVGGGKERREKNGDRRCHCCRREENLKVDRVYSRRPFVIREFTGTGFAYNLLEGPLPDKISPSVVRLRLGSNAFNGSIPSLNFAALENLTYLELDNNRLTGTIPPRLGDCQNLALLNLAQNKLNGSLPAQLGNLSRLQVMKLQLNDLGGEIPFEFPQLKSLSQLDISWNLLTGSIPSSFSKLQRLRNLNLQDNHLSGSIPHSIGNMDFLIELQLGENQLRGQIPKLPEKLQTGLNLSSNLFEGPIPNSLSWLTVLEVLDLSHNNFSGEIPKFFTQMQCLVQLILSYNQLSGIVPEFSFHVSVNITGNLGLRIVTEPNASQMKENRRIPVAVLILMAVAAGVFAAGLITVMCSFFLRIIRRNRKE